MQFIRILVLMLFCVPAFLGCKGETETQVIESPAADEPVDIDPGTDLVDEPADDDEAAFDDDEDADG